MPKKGNQSLLHVEDLRWEPIEISGARGGCWIKTLAKDEATGARTVLVKFGAGYAQLSAVSRVHADIFVLDGQMECGDRTYRKYTYHFRPAGSEIGPVRSGSGITRLMYLAAPGERTSSKEIFVDTTEIPWEKGYATTTSRLANGTPMRSHFKVLRQDPDTDTSILMNSHLDATGLDFPGVGITHDSQEEVYCLEGMQEDYLGDVDGHIRWGAGTYICRQPNASMHGDVLLLETPQTFLIRRYYIKDMYGHHQSKRNVLTNLQPIVFAE